MKNNYEFSKGTKHPYVGQLKKGYTVVVHRSGFENETKETETDVKNKSDVQHQQKKV